MQTFGQPIHMYPDVGSFPAACSPLQCIQGFVELRCQLHQVGAPQRLEVALKHLPLLGQPLQGWGEVGAVRVREGRQEGRRCECGTVGVGRLREAREAHGGAEARCLLWWVGGCW